MIYPLILESMDPESLISSAVLYLVFGSIGVFLVYAGYRTFQNRRLLSKAKRISESEQLRSGDQPVLADGTKTPVQGEPLEAPYSNNKCVAYEWKIRRVSGNDAGNDGGWSTIHSGQDRIPFLLNTDNKGFRVDPREAEIQYDFGMEETTVIDDLESTDIDAEIDEPLDEHKGYQFAENHIPLDESSSVIGKLTQTVEDADYELVETDTDEFTIWESDVEDTQRRYLRLIITYLLLGLVLVLSPLIIYFASFNIFLLLLILSASLSFYQKKQNDNNESVIAD